MNWTGHQRWSMLLISLHVTLSYMTLHLASACSCRFPGRSSLSHPKHIPLKLDELPPHWIIINQAASKEDELELKRRVSKPSEKHDFVCVWYEDCLQLLSFCAAVFKDTSTQRSRVLWLMQRHKKCVCDAERLIGGEEKGEAFSLQHTGHDRCMYESCTQTQLHC